MVSKTFTLLFRLKRPTHYVKGPQPIYLRLTVDGKRVEVSVQRECDPAKWNSTTGRALGTKEDIKILNAYLDTLQRKVYEVYQTLLDVREMVTADKIKSHLVGAVEKPRMLLDIFQQHNDQMKALIGNGYAPLTHRRFTTALGHTREFIHWKYNIGDYAITKLNYEFISEFEFYLRSVRKCAHNSTMKYLANFKKVVLQCVKKGWLNKDPFYGFCLGGKPVVREFLTQVELDTIRTKQFSAPRLNIVRDIFLFSCYTGLAYVDVRKLKRSEIRMGMDGEQWIFTQRQKTEVTSRIPLLPICLEVLKRYQNHPQCNNEDRVLPVWSNQKMNEYLKRNSRCLWYSKAAHLSHCPAYLRHNGHPKQWCAD